MIKKLVKKIKPLWLIPIIVSVFGIFFSCDLKYEEDAVFVITKDEEPDPPEPEPEPDPEDIVPPDPLEMNERKWTILIYMSADNNLESSALEDICEMESSILNTDAVTVLMLLDRNPAYDTTNENWYGTKLFKLKTGRDADSKTMISEEIECKALGLNLESETELDMSSDYTLSNFISFSTQRFPAENYGLIIWGHGTGWRGNETNNYKGFAYDETSKTYMTLFQLAVALKNGLRGHKLDFIGFDTCFGGELEVFYELKDYVNYAVGSEGLIMSSGWDYEALFSQFQRDGQGTVQSLCDSIVFQFKKQYAFSNRASIVAADLNNSTSLFLAFDKVCQLAAGKITSSKIRDEIMELLYTGQNCSTEKYSYGTVGNDIYLDIHSMVSNFQEYFAGDEEIQTACQKFFQTEKETLIQNWASDRSEGALGVYFSTLTEGNYLSVSHPAAYIKNRTNDQISFVKDSNGYVPAEVTGDSLLDKLFYQKYN